MSETKKISTTTIVRVSNTLLDIYTSYRDEAVATLSSLIFFIKDVLGYVGDVNFAEGELGYQINDLPNTSFVLNDYGELIAIDVDATVYSIDGVGDLIYNDVLVAPVAVPASIVVIDGFKANWNAVPRATKYYIDISLDAHFNTLIVGYQNLELGNVLFCNITGLLESVPYYYRVRAYDGIQTSIDSNIILAIPQDIIAVTDIDGNQYHSVIIGTQEWLVENLKTAKYRDGTKIPNITEANGNLWYLPSFQEINGLYANRVALGMTGIFWSSTEGTSTTAYQVNFDTGLFSDVAKSTSLQVRPVRNFIADGAYSIGDTGPLGGIITEKTDLGGGLSYKYVECRLTSVANSIWSNRNTTLIGATAQTVYGNLNTLAIIGQSGHTTSAAKLCNDLGTTIGWIGDVTGARAWYNNDIANKPDYGALYNWYAVNNVHGLAPTGWRVPSDSDWTILWNFIGMTPIGGGLYFDINVIKEAGTVHWLSAYGRDLYGFKMLGSGLRTDFDGSFAVLKEEGLHWSSTSVDSFNAKWRVGYDGGSAEIQNAPKNYGLAIRCMRDI
jgi:uncharacterized protein (TIGR02145 family)